MKTLKRTTTKQKIKNFLKTLFSTKYPLIKLISLALISAITILIEQQIAWGIFFDIEDFLHHENFAAILIAFATGIIFTLIILKKPIRKN